MNIHTAIAVAKIRAKETGHRQVVWERVADVRYAITAEGTGHPEDLARRPCPVVIVVVCEPDGTEHPPATAGR